MRLEDRFWKKVDKTDGCWLWTGAKSSSGYGRFFKGVGQPRVQAHHVSLNLAGVDTIGKIVHHTCRVRTCVKPAHLVLFDSTKEHFQEHRKHTHASVVQAIVDYNSEYGRPPRATDWNTGIAARLGHTDRLEAWREHDWPPASVVVKLFGSWGNAIEAAGFPRPRVGRPTPR